MDQSTLHPDATQQRPADRAEEAVEQRSAGERAWSKGHAVNVRLSLPSPFGRFYLVVIGGRERRSTERRAAERRQHPLVTAGNLLFFLACGAVAGLTTLGLIQLLGRVLLEASGMATF